MYPLDVTMVGCDGDLLELLRLELSVHSAKIDAAYLGIESAIGALGQNGAPEHPRKLAAQRNLPGRSAEVSRRLFIVRLDSPDELGAIKRLSSCLPGNPIIVLMDQADDPSIPITAMRMGASQFVTLPLQADDFK